MIHSPTVVAEWARASLAALDPPGDAVARVRLRLLPSPFERGEGGISVPWDGHRTADALGETVLARLAGHELPAHFRVRLDCLDGTGTPIRGAAPSRTFTAPAHPEPSPMPAPTPAPTRAAATAPPLAELLDADGLDVETSLKAAQAYAGLATRGAAPDGDASGREPLQTITLHALGLGLHLLGESHRMQTRTTQLLLARSQQDGVTIRELADEVRRGGQARDGLLEEVLPAMIEAVGSAADSRAEARVATVEAERTVALAEAGGEQTPAQQALTVLQEASAMLGQVKIRRGPATPAAPAPAPAPAVDDSTLPTGKSPTPAAATPPASDGDAAEQLGRVLRGELPAALAGRVLVARLSPSERVHAEALARAILAASGTAQQQTEAA